MIALTLDQVAAAVGGVVHDCEDPAALRVTGEAFVDSRAPQREGLFVAVPGERVDGHDYAAAAVSAGAAAVLAGRPVGVPAVVVADPVAALTELARHVVAQLPGLRVVGVTGSAGKTTTKDLLAQVLLRAFGDDAVVATRGSFNNEIGLPLTALRAGRDTRFLVLEMGARGAGHIRHLCTVAPPFVGLVLNVGTAHIGEFGSSEGIAEAKGELVEAVVPGGVAVLSADDPLVASMAERTSGRVRTFGESPQADVRLSDLVLDELERPGFVLHADGQSAHVQLLLLGAHQAGNAAAAAAAALELGVRLDTAADALGAVAAVSRWRMELTERADGLVVLNDAYNASPDSVRAALRTLASLGRRRGDRGDGGVGTATRTVAVLGEMRELGEASRDEHDAVGRLAVRLDVSQLVVVGEAARPLHLGARQEGSWGGESAFVDSVEDAVAWVTEHVTPSDVVLVKASRTVGLERVAAALLGQDGER